MKYQNWIKSPTETGRGAVTFVKKFEKETDVVRAVLRVTGLGVYQAHINGEKIGRQVLTPGWTTYTARVQYQTEDITQQLKNENTLTITAAPGWAVGRIGYQKDISMYCDHLCVVAELELTKADGTVHYITTGNDWEVYTSQVTFADIYDGETVDRSLTPEFIGNAVNDETSFHVIPQVGADIIEHEHIAPVELIVTPKGERVLDFGQNMTGYVALKIKAKKGEKVVLSHGEVLDWEGNFYKENYRTAKNIVTFVCSGNEDLFKPEYSFQGFRYIRIDEYPDVELKAEDFRAIVVHSEMERTGHFACGNAKINQLYHNIIWGQKSNYLDIPTDCPQRDERLGWTGDTQVFSRTAAMNYDVRKFFEKWLGDLRIEQHPDGGIGGVCPEKFGKNYHTRTATGWGDVAVIVPWTLYEIYGDKSFLADNFDMMQKWVEYMHHAGPEEYLWLGGYHYGDWLAMDAGEDSYVGATSNDLIASAFFANSVDLLVRAGEVLGKDMSEYKAMYANVVKAFRSYFMENGMPKEEFPYTEILPSANKAAVDTVRKGITQTALVLILHFNLCLPEERAAIAEKLEELIHSFGDKMSTGFLGTPYILHTLSACGKQELAYKLFFNEENPSWLYSVNHGATTIWEHWNGIKEDGSFWSTDMNSFNHYAYGAVCDWMYGEICGVKILKDGAGYRKIRIAPHPCEKLGFAKCALETVSGRIESHWYYSDDRICFEIMVPDKTVAEIALPNGFSETVTGGSHCYSVKRQ